MDKPYPYPKKEYPERNTYNPHHRYPQAYSRYQEHQQRLAKSTGSRDEEMKEKPESKAVVEVPEAKIPTEGPKPSEKPSETGEKKPSVSKPEAERDRRSRSHSKRRSSASSDDRRKRSSKYHNRNYHRSSSSSSSTSRSGHHDKRRERSPRPSRPDHNAMTRPPYYNKNVPPPRDSRFSGPPSTRDNNYSRPAYDRNYNSSKWGERKDSYQDKHSKYPPRDGVTISYQADKRGPPLDDKFKPQYTEDKSKPREEAKKPAETQEKKPDPPASKGLDLDLSSPQGPTMTIGATKTGESSKPEQQTDSSRRPPPPYMRYERHNEPPKRHPIFRDHEGEDQRRDPRDFRGAPSNEKKPYYSAASRGDLEAAPKSGRDYPPAKRPSYPADHHSDQRGYKDTRYPEKRYDSNYYRGGYHGPRRSRSRERRHDAPRRPEEKKPEEGEIKPK